MIQSFEMEFANHINGHLAIVDMQNLSGGAEINRIFHERFRYDLLKVIFQYYYYY